VFKSSMNKILIIVLFLKIILIIDLKRFIFKNLRPYMLFQILKRCIIEKDVIHKNSYDVFYWPRKSVLSLFSLSLSHTLSFSQ
jgi:hypothetical protein